MVKKRNSKTIGKMDECITKTKHKIDWSNEDHCGPCGQYLKSKPKDPKL
jgi:hypothetical protein